LIDDNITNGFNELSSEQRQLDSGKRKKFVTVSDSLNLPPVVFLPLLEKLKAFFALENGTPIAVQMWCARYVLDIKTKSDKLQFYDYRGDCLR
jgi:hypothetical protein